MKSEEDKYTILLLALFGVIGLAFLFSASYIVFLVLLGLVLRRKKSPGWILAISILFIFLFYVGIHGCRCIEGAGAANVAGMLFLTGSLSGLALMVIQVARKKEMNLFTAPVLLVTISPIFTALIVQTYATLFDIHGFVFYI